MKKLRLIDAATELSRIMGASGMAVTDARVLTRLNRAIEELMNKGDWPGILDRYRFAVYGGMITLPGDLERIVSVAANGLPVDMVSPWYEFAANGPGPQDSQTWVDVALDRGEACTIQPIPAGEPCQLQVVGELDERVSGVRPKILIRGYNADGAWVRSDIAGTRSDGIELEINGDTAPKQVNSPFNFTGVEAVIKPRTKGYVSLYAQGSTARYHLATYAPNETLPTYRKYFIPILDQSATNKILVRARKRFIPVRSDNDFLLITNMGALEEMLAALQCRKTNDINGYYGHKKAAVELLKEEAKSYLGEPAKKPAITFGRGFGTGGVDHVQ